LAFALRQATLSGADLSFLEDIRAQIGALDRALYESLYDSL
jgi:hypothetical protein